MSPHHKLSKKSFFAIFLLSLFFSNNSWSLDLNNESDRKAIASEKSRKFLKSIYPTRRWISLSAYRDSDYNSKDYRLTTTYRHSGSRLVSNFDLDHQAKYSDSGTRPGKTVRIKKSELYDLLISSKVRILEQNNYVALYHRTIYDDMSDYYYDLQTAVGLGRFFFDQNLELDLSIGYRDVKTYGYNVNFIPSLRFKIDVTDRFRIVNRSFLFIDHESMDNDFKTSFIYDITNNLSGQLTHDFEQRRYEDDLKKRAVINRVDRRITIGLIYRF